jgi:hypothetical protein
MRIGNAKRIYTIEPIESPVPRLAPPPDPRPAAPAPRPTARERVALR